MKPPLSERCRGRWRGILAALGVDRKYLTGRHSACPICRQGKDRFRFTDFEQSGAWICNSCGHGGGTDLVMRIFGIDFAEAAKRIEGVIGFAQTEKKREQKTSAEQLAAMKKLWDESRPISTRCCVGIYLANRGLKICDALRWAPGKNYSAMVAKVTDRNGKSVNIHRTLIDDFGKKATGDQARLFMPGQIPAGSAIRLFMAAPVMGVAEGIETALSASAIFRIPVWSAMNSSRLETFIPPPECRHLVICGDNDLTFGGQKAAYTLAHRVAVNGIKVNVEIPAKPGTDWNDFWLERILGLADGGNVVGLPGKFHAVR
ncbi:MAG: toprim domain-containing protein [Patescibacteria group bacterium]|nr:toprim domain-containing protein [Patescibacteria group bacterium]